MKRKKIFLTFYDWQDINNIYVDSNVAIAVTRDMTITDF